jgi:hypothetical protein
MRKFMLLTVPTLLPLVAGAQTPPVVLTSPNARPDGLFGVSVSGVPDVDGDGRGDLLVAGDGEGDRAYLFSGATRTLLHTLASPNPVPSGDFGRALSGVPDADGDGRGDLLVGARGEEVGEGLGRAYLFSGATGALLRTFESPNPSPSPYPNLTFGFSVSGVTDTDGDGKGDALVGSPGELEAAGRAYVFAGGGIVAAEPASEGAAPPMVSPNPAAGTATFTFALERPAAVRLALYDVLGREVAVVDARVLAAGAHRLALDLSALPPGVYVWRLGAGEQVENGRVTVAR